MGDDVDEEPNRWQPRKRWSQTIAGQIVIGAGVLALVALGIWTAVDGLQTKRRSSAPPAEEVVAPVRHRLTGPILTIVEALPTDTTAIGAVHVGDLLALHALPLGEPGFERLTQVLDDARACGVDIEQQLALVVFVQRVHRMERQGTGDPGDAHNVMILQGALTPAVLEACQRQFGREVKTRWLADGVVAIALNDLGARYLDELAGPGPRVLSNPRFARHAVQIEPDALAWAWMDLRPVKLLTPKEPWPETLGALVSAEPRSLDILLTADFADERLAGAVETQWRRSTADAPAGSLAREWQYYRDGRALMAHADLPMERVTDAAAFVVGMLKSM